MSLLSHNTGVPQNSDSNTQLTGQGTPKHPKTPPHPQRIHKPTRFLQVFGEHCHAAEGPPAPHPHQSLGWTQAGMCLSSGPSSAQPRHQTQLLPGWGHQRGAEVSLLHTLWLFCTACPAPPCQQLLCAPPSTDVGIPRCPSASLLCQGAPAVHPALTPSAGISANSAPSQTLAPFIHLAAGWVPHSLLGHTEAGTPENLAGVAAG